MAGMAVAREQSGQSPERTRVRRSPEDAERLLLSVIGRHADSLLRVARRHSLCADDAQDAYQRTLEIFLRHAATLEEEGAPRWAHTVVKHEAMRVRSGRLRYVGSEEADLDSRPAANAPDPDERVLAFDRMSRSAEALQRLKPQELRALWLKAQGLSYDEIAEACGWTYTKVNRCITEGRRAFLERYAGIESGDECRRWAPVLCALVDGEASADELARARPHLRNCPACRATIRELHESGDAIAAVLPLGLVGAGFAGHPHAGAAGGLLSRVYEALAGPIHERAVVSAVKLQAAVEAAATGKVAAVAASAAALAGGGVAVDQAVEHGRRPAQHPTVVGAQNASARLARDVLGSVRGVAPAAPTRPEPSAGDAAVAAHAAARARAAARSREFDNDSGASGAGGARASAASTSSSSTAPVPAQREFAAAPAMATAASTPNGSAPSGSSAAPPPEAVREFGP